MESSSRVLPSKRPSSSLDRADEDRPAKQKATGQPSQDLSRELFDGMSREAFLMKHVHKKLHTQAASLSDDELAQLGKLGFNQQFARFENGEASDDGCPFGGIGREGYMQGRVHRRLHLRCQDLSDQELLDLGRMSFNQQFLQFGEGPPPVGAAPMVHQQGPLNLFGSMTRVQFIQQRIHRRLHPQCAELTDEELAEIGRLSFNEQFPIFEQFAQIGNQSNVRQQPPVDFGVLGRDGFMSQRVHRRLHAAAASLNDRDLLELGRLSFNDQFPTIERLFGARGLPEASRIEKVAPSSMFGPLGRDGYLQQRVHRKLHAHAAQLSDHELLDLGKLSFNDQFPYFNLEPSHPPARKAEAATTAPGPEDMFGGLGREAYMRQRVHRKLHHLAMELGDAELSELGRLTFNEQFPMLEQDLDPHEIDTVAEEGELFGGMSREAFLVKHVHRKLHNHADALSDEDLTSLGKLTFNEQFPFLGQDQMRLGVTAGSSPRAQQPTVMSFATDADRESFIEKHIHRKLHGYAAGLADQDVLDFGRRSFNEQFSILEGLSAAPPKPRIDYFGGLGREGYMEQRVHRKLHAQAATLSDQDLMELGRLKFNDQFPWFEQPIGIVNGGLQPRGADLFAGLGGRQAYMNNRVHRRLHPHAACLSDQDLLELGKLTFNDQFPTIENMSGRPQPVVERSPKVSELFGTLGREGFLQQRVHRKLHAQAAELEDHDLAELGHLSFNQQFVTLGHPPI